MTLGLGTVQLGMKYGVTNSRGQVPFEEAGRILSLAKDADVRILDTAPAYGASEEVLGKILPQDHRFQIVTKTPHLAAGTAASDAVRRLTETFEASLARLRQKKVYGLLVHGPEDLLQPFGKPLFAEMQRLKKAGWVEKIGVSVYDARQIDRILDAFDVDLVQLPLSVLDQRLVRSGHLQKLKKRGVEIHVRSVFLQGVLLTPPEALPAHFDSIRGRLRRYHDMVHSLHMTPVQAALTFANALQEVDVVLCGVTSQDQLQQALEKAVAPISTDVFSDFAIEDPDILNPARWEGA